MDTQDIDGALTDPMICLAANLERARAELGMSRVQLARKIGIEQTTFNRLFNAGKRGQSVTLDTVAAVAKGLGVSVPALLARSEPPEPRSIAVELAVLIESYLALEPADREELQDFAGLLCRSVDAQAAMVAGGDEHDEIALLAARVFRCEMQLQVGKVTRASDAARKVMRGVSAAVANAGARPPGSERSAALLRLHALEGRLHSILSSSR